MREDAVIEWVDVVDGSCTGSERVWWSVNIKGRLVGGGCLPISVG